MSQDIKKLQALYQGKAKTVFATDNPDLYIMEFRDDISAFNGVKLEKLKNKGAVNNQINTFIMQKLRDAGIESHFVAQISPHEALVHRLEMVPVECVVRNVAAGNLCKKLGIERGLKIDPPLFEFFLKSDELGDPMITDDHIRAFKWATDAEIKELRQLSTRVNEILKPLFANAGMMLVDYKLEFGRYQGRLVLGDEFSPDGCRIWDTATSEVMDKDRFRQDMGRVVEHYEEIAKRLGITLQY